METLAREVCLSGDVHGSVFCQGGADRRIRLCSNPYLRDSEETVTAAQQRIAEIRAQAATEMPMKMGSSMQCEVFASF